MNKVVAMVSVVAIAAVAGSAFGQTVWYDDGASGSAADRQERELRLVERQHALKERVHRLKQQQMAFAGVKDGVVTVPLRISDNHESNIHITTDDVEIKVNQDDRDVVVTIDGDEVYSGELDPDFESFEFETADGTVVKLVNAKDQGGNFVFGGDMDAFAEGEVLRALELAEGARVWAKGLGQAQGFSQNNPPKVMMGVTLSGVDQTVAKQLGIDREATTLIGSVIDDLPAKKAGLEEDDIVIAVDGNLDASPMGIRKVLREKEPGDTLVLDVLRGGEPMQVVLNLEAYDGKALGNSFTFSGSVTPGWSGEVSEEAFREWMQGLIDGREEVQGALADADSEEQRQELRAKLAELDAQVEVAREKIATGDYTIPFGARGMHFAPEDIESIIELRLGELPNVRFFDEHGGPAVVVPPVPPLAPNQEVKVLIERLQNSSEAHQRTVEEMQVRIEQLERQLERALEKLEQKNGPDA